MLEIDVYIIDFFRKFLVCDIILLTLIIFNNLNINRIDEMIFDIRIRTFNEMLKFD